MDYYSREGAIVTTDQPNKVAFRWQYIALPVVFLALAAILAAIFYSKLPPDVAYHFQGDTPDKYITRGAFTGWMIIPHAFFILLAFFMVRMLTLGAKYAPPGETPLLQLLPLMGNMAALPQIIIFVIMLQLCLYNAYNTGIIPLWITAVVILAAGGLALVLMFMRIKKQYGKKKAKIIQE